MVNLKIHWFYNSQYDVIIDRKFAFKAGNGMFLLPSAISFMSEYV